MTHDGSRARHQDENRVSRDGHCFCGVYPETSTFINRENGVNHPGLGSFYGVSAVYDSAASPQSEALLAFPLAQP